MRPASPILASNNPGDCPVVPRVLLVLTGPATPSVPHGPGTGTGKISGAGWNDPSQDRSRLWLRNAAAGLCVRPRPPRRSASPPSTAWSTRPATFPWSPRSRRRSRTPPPWSSPAPASLWPARPPGAARPGAGAGLVAASVFMNAIAAAPGWRNLAIWRLPAVAYALASDTLIGVVRARALARHLQPGAALAADAAAPLAVLGGVALWLLRLALAPASTLAGFRGWVLAECPVAPGRRAPAPGPAPAPPAEGDEDDPVPGPAHRTARVPRLYPARCRRRDQRRPCAPLGLHPARPAPPSQGRPGREERSPPMTIKLAIALVVVLIMAAFAARAFLPARHPPGNRARHLRIRLHLRLHPGKGFAHAFSLWLRWSRFAVLRRSGRIRPALPLRYPFVDPREHSVFLGRAHYRHGLRVPLEEHLLAMAPPRTFKTAFLADGRPRATPARSSPPAPSRTCTR